VRTQATPLVCGPCISKKLWPSSRLYPVTLNLAAAGLGPRYWPRSNAGPD
jgi:hypothetical protein